MTEDQEDAKKTLNNDKPEINRGVELLLRNRRKKPDPPKTFQVSLEIYFLSLTEKLFFTSIFTSTSEKNNNLWEECHV